jgi:hypothetical protein
MRTSFQTGGEADDAVGLALARDDGLRPIQIIRRGRHCGSATHQRSYHQHPDHDARHSST